MEKEIEGKTRNKGTKEKDRTDGEEGRGRRMNGQLQDDDKYSSWGRHTRNGEIQEEHEVGGTTGEEEDLAPGGMRGMINAIFGETM